MGLDYSGLKKKSKLCLNTPSGISLLDAILKVKSCSMIKKKQLSKKEAVQITKVAVCRQCEWNHEQKRNG
jgi:primosomal replication protein N